MFGFINLNKPQGFTSHDCVGKIRRLINFKKVGHGGTLDPEATGVLPIAVGKATRLLQFLPEKKAYRARIRLGVQTTTDDLEGEIITTKSDNNLSSANILEYLNYFQGEIEQKPPIYSAIKQKGRKLYELARKGIEVEVPTRKITIYRCQLLEISEGEFTELEVDIECSAGTYIRAIARDLGSMLGVGGTLANLIRTESCSFQLADSLDFTAIADNIQQQSFHLIKPDYPLSHLPVLNLNPEESKRWLFGQRLPILPERISNREKSINLDLTTLENRVYVRVYQEKNQFLGISLLQITEDNLIAKPQVVCGSN